MDDDNEDLFDDLNRQFADMLNERDLEALERINEHWMRFGGVISQLEGDEEAGDWLEEALGAHGISVRALMIFGLKMAVKKNVPPMDYTASFVSGYIAGALAAKEEAGEDVLEQILATKPEGFEPREKPELGFLKIHGYDGPAVLSTIDDVGKFMREQSRNVAEDFTEQDDDWEPILLVVGEELTTMVGMDIPNVPRLKHELFTNVIPRAMRKLVKDPLVAGFLVSAWGLPHGILPEELDAMMKRGDRISGREDRIEMLFMHLRNVGGEREMWTAPINRAEEQPPGLGEWVKVEGMDKLGGSVADMIDGIFS